MFSAARSPRTATALLLLPIVLAACGVRHAAAPGAPRVPRVINVAHRGASGHAPEHTIAAYDLALQMGADYIEQDLQLTRDGVLVVLHDATLDRTARGPASDCAGRVIEKTLAQLRTCDVGSWFNERFPGAARPEHVGLRIPTLEEVLERYGRRARYYIETKNPEDAPGMEDQLLRLLGKFGLLEPAAVRERAVLIQSFSAASLRTIHAREPSLPLIQLVGGPDSTSALVRSRLAEVARYAAGVGPGKAAVDSALVAGAHARCLDVHPYTVDAAGDMEALIALSVDGMFTNLPDRLGALLSRAAARAAPRPGAGRAAGCAAAR